MPVEVSTFNGNIALGKGLTAAELPDSSSKAEVMALADEVKNY